MNTKEEILDKQKLEDGYYRVRYAEADCNWMILELRANKWCIPGTWQHMHSPDIISERILSPAETAPSLPYVGWVKASERLPEESYKHFPVRYKGAYSVAKFTWYGFVFVDIGTLNNEHFKDIEWLDENLPTQYPAPSMVEK